MVRKGIGILEGIVDTEPAFVEIHDLPLNRGSLQGHGQVGGNKPGRFRQKERLPAILASGVNGHATGKRDVVVRAIALIQRLDNRIVAGPTADAKRTGPLASLGRQSG